MAVVVALGLPGTSLAAGEPEGGEPQARQGGSPQAVSSASAVLARGAGYAVDGGSEPVRRLQRRLRGAGYAPGPVDGLYGALTEAAVRSFQLARGLAVDGIVGPETRAALDASARRGGIQATLELQRMLRTRGYDPGPVDGAFGPLTRAAVQWFQAHHGLDPTGVADAATLRRLRNAAPASELVAPPLPSAGWHGRPIRNPHRHGAVAGTRAARRGPPPVRRIQRALLRRGYEPGPPDGFFGPRTKAALQWYQLKHGLQPSGIADFATLEHLSGPSTAPPATSRPDPPSPGPQPRAASRSQPNPRQDEKEHGSALALPLVALLGALGAAALWLLSKTVRDRRRRQAATAAALAVGYARGRDRDELDHQAATIEQACRERGWTLARVIQDHGQAGPKSLKRPGLAHTLKQLREGGAALLVVDRLERLGRSLAELRALLQWCARNDVALVALDVGLDTSTQEGRVAAGCLLAVGNGQRAKRPQQARERTPSPV